jgi:hypothetical protein
MRIIFEDNNTAPSSSLLRNNGFFSEDTVIFASGVNNVSREILNNILEDMLFVY